MSRHFGVSNPAVLSVSQSLNLVRPSAAPVAEIDPHSSYVSLLLKGDAANNSTNNTFVDDGPSNLAITRFSTTTQGSFSPFSRQSGAWSHYFNGASSEIFSKSPSSWWQITDDFTIEAWVNTNGSAGSQTVIGINSLNLNSFQLIAKGNGLGTANTIQFFYNTGTWSSVQSTLTFSAGEWVHIAVTRQGSTLRLFVNGVKNPTEFTVSGSFANNGTAPRVGTNGLGGNTYAGYISNLRMVYGTALYTSDFTPPTSITEVPGTKLIACAENRIKDSSSNGASVSIVGAPLVSTYSPIPDTDEVTTSELGSGYFNGTTDYLTLADSNDWTFAGDFTIDAWVYPEVTTGMRTIVAQWPGQTATNCSFIMAIVNSKLYSTYGIGSSNIGVTGAATLIPNTWMHVAVSRSGTTLRLFVNGTLDGTATVSGAYNNSNGVLSIGRTNANDAGYLKGHVSNLRIINGTSLYTGNFSVPTGPTTAVANTKLLLNFANAGAVDSFKNLTLTTVGNAKISTDQSKYGGSSVSFDGTNSVAWVGKTLEPGLSLRTGDFTIEGWVRLNAAVSGDPDCIYGNYGTTNRAGAHLLRILSSSKVGFYVYPTATDALVSTTSLQVGSWYHIAISRASGTTRMFINGVLEASTTVSLDLTSDPARPATLGNYWQITGTYAASSWLNGYIDDFRITKGVARYTANFTPPDSLPTSGT